MYTGIFSYELLISTMGFSFLTSTRLRSMRSLFRQESHYRTGAKLLWFIRNISFLGIEAMAFVFPKIYRVLFFKSKWRLHLCSTARHSSCDLYLTSRVSVILEFFIFHYELLLIACTREYRGLKSVTSKIS